ncbi:hypothetical protein MLD38_008313 [Melastoma candidum]|uniref:Uncharacterized protein n=1 Tax=Melastoma candidum TaxID=119954 RepID=A0ACB9RV68_9MYRT|nr:hypothetical protein MLD38_008313 [Melastoma candidum]
MAMPGPPDVKDKSSTTAAAVAAPPSPNPHSLHPQPHHHPHAHPRPLPPQPYYLDERDGLISWLRGEFAAANAIIDSLLNHLRSIGDPGEYDAVLASISQRRCNWTTILYMQQYFPISDVVYALKQAAWRRQQQQAYMSNNSRKEYRRGNFNHSNYNNNNHSNNHNHANNTSGRNLGSGRVKEGVSPRSVEKRTESDCKDEDVKGFDGDAVGEEEKGVAPKAQADPTLKNSEVVGENACDASNSESDKSEGCASTPNGAEQNQKVKQSANGVPRTFVANELIDGRTVNTVEGLKLYDLLDDTEVRKLHSLANDLRAAGKRGQFQGQTYVASKRPMKGHGREMIQLGVPVTDSLPEVESVGIHKGRKIESIPALLQDVIDRLLRMQIVTVKPDSCTIDFYYEGDHSHPHSWPHWYGRPVCMLSLTECDMSFGKTFTINPPGDFRGALKLSLLPGSLLVMQGLAADLAKHAIPPIRKQRILVTFTKCQPRKPIPGDARVPAPTAVQPPQWGLPTPRPLNHVPHPAASKHFPPGPGTTGALPATAIHPQISATNGMPTLYVAAPVVPAIPFPGPVAIPATPSGWTTVPQRHPPPPHLPAPGTGVFLPPQGSGNPSSPELSSGEQNRNASVSPNGKQADMKKGRPEANGGVHGPKDSKNEEKHIGEDARKAAGKQNGTV